MRLKRYYIMQLNDAKWIAVTIDMWSSDPKLNFITITAHYTDEQFVVQHSVLETLDFVGEHCNDNIPERIKDALVRWDMLSSIICVVTDNTHTMLKVGRKLGLDSCVCFSDFLQTVVKVCTDEPNIAAQLLNVEKTVSHIRISQQSSDDLHAAQKKLSLTPHDLVHDAQTYWHSSFYTLQRFVREEQPLSLLFVNQDFLNRLKSTSIVTGIDFQVLKLLLKLLEPLEELTREVSSATTVTLSL
ncbi:unnamed protein product, partial [Didymodactylos carnosus]